MVNFIGQNNNIGFVYQARAMSKVCEKSVKRLLAQWVVQSAFFSLPTLVGFVGIVDVIKGRLRSNRFHLVILDSVLFEMREFCHSL